MGETGSPVTRALTGFATVSAGQVVSLQARRVADPAVVWTSANAEGGGLSIVQVA